jgi:DNA/RNA-binding domain of Phe-tRNA-synthetase-like protein
VTGEEQRVHLQHVEEVRARFPGLVAGVLVADGITADADVGALVEEHLTTARARLDGRTESDLPEVRAWRRAFAAMGLRPTQYRCASEALLRRLRRDGTLPRLRPLVDLCNAVSTAYAVPVAALDLDRINGELQVRPATGTERYLSFAGEEEHPEPGEVVFVDAAQQAHARRWTNRQSAASAVRADTRTVLVVAEALHDTAARDVAALVGTLARQVAGTWPTEPVTAVLTAAEPRFTVPARFVRAGPG